MGVGGVPGKKVQTPSTTPASPVETTKKAEAAPEAVSTKKAPAAETAKTEFTQAKEADKKSASTGPTANKATADRDKMSLGKAAGEKLNEGFIDDAVDWVKDKLKAAGDFVNKAIEEAKKKEAAKATNADAAKPTKTPTAAQIKEIDDAIKAGDNQKAIDKTVEYYGIDTKNVNGKIKYDSSVTDANAETNPQRQIAIGPSAVEGVTPQRLAATLLHEVTHANQVAKHGWPENRQEVAAYEAMGYQAALSQADKLGLSDTEKQWYTDKVASNRGRLSDENKTKYDGGQYWDLK